MARPHTKQLLSDAELEAKKERVARLVAEGQLAMTEEVMAGSKEYIRGLKRLASSARDERARFSALAKLTELALPAKQGPMVTVNVGQNFISHLGLPPPSEPKAIDVGGEFRQLPQRPGILPEPTVMPRQIAAPPAVEVQKVVPETAHRTRFLSSRVAMDEAHGAPETAHFDPKTVPEATPATLSGVPKQPAGHPAASQYDK